MKKLMLLLAVLAPLWLTSCGGTKKLSNHALCGVWQNCYVSVDHGQPRVHFQPFLKALNSDGTFVNMVLEEERMCSFITTMGKWSPRSDTVYVENVTRSLTAELDRRWENRIRYRMQGNDFMVVRYRLEDSRRWCTEYWVRVIQPDRIDRGKTERTIMDNFRREFDNQNPLDD